MAWEWLIRWKPQPPPAHWFRNTPVYSMRKESLLLVASCTLTLLIGLGLIRWLAPQLLGISPDLRLVQVDRKVPPFFEGVFRREDLMAHDFLLNDPLTGVRARPFFPTQRGLGPNDLLGFRNRSVPSMAEIVVIGDSQTYGNNAHLEENWPSQMQSQLQGSLNETYAMAVGGWGAVQYLDMFHNASVFRPRAVVVAFYSGNDPLESFQMVYGNPHWRPLIPNPDLSAADVPSIRFPAPESEWWGVSFADGVKTTFTPTLRLAANQDHSAVSAGYSIMAAVGARMVRLAEPAGIRLLFTVIPTKELVYAKKVGEEGLAAPADYQTLVARERANIDALASALQALPGARYVDLVEPLQRAAMDSLSLYPSSQDGHPLAAGYSVIGETIANAAREYLTPRPSGLFAVATGKDSYLYALANEEGRWHFATPELAVANGWPADDVPVLPVRDFVALPLRGTVHSVDPRRFGPDGHT